MVPGGCVPVEHPGNERRGYGLRASHEQPVPAAEELPTVSLGRHPAILDAIGEPYYTLDEHWRFTLVNAAAQRHFGKKAAELLGRSLFELFPFLRGSACEEQFVGAMETQTPRHFEVLSPVTRGWIDVHAHPSPAGLTVCLRDLSEKKEAIRALRASEERLRLSLEAGQMGCWDWDLASGRITWSPHLERIHGLAPGSFDGRFETYQRDMHPEDRERVLDSIRRAIAGEIPHHLEYRLLLDDGTVRWVEARGTVHRDAEGRATGMSGVCTDVTERKRMEQALRESNERLGRAVRERTRELEASHQRLRTTERMAAIGTLAAGIGHDMGNLLMPIRARVESLEAAGLPGACGEDVAAIRTCTEYLQRLARALRLLALDPASAGEPEEPVALHDWWADVLPMMRGALAREIVLEADIPEGLPGVAVPRHQLTQLVFNLIQNAGQAARGPGSARVRVQAAALVEPKVELRVIDNGVGMTPDVRARCLEPFFSTRPRSGSTGLGLALVAGVIERVGGSIEIESAPERGTVFAVKLPIASGGGRGMGAPAVACVRVGDPRLASLAASLLEGLGARVERGGSGDGASLLVSDNPAEADRFAASSPERCAISMGGVGGERVLALAASPKIGELREAVRRALALCPRPG